MKRQVRVTRTEDFWVEYDGRKMNEAELLEAMNRQMVGPNAFHGRPEGSISSSPIIYSTYRAEILTPENVEEPTNE